MEKREIAMNPDIVIALAILIVSVVGVGLTLLEINRRVKHRNSQLAYEKAISNHPAGKRLRTEEDIQNGR